MQFLKLFVNISEPYNIRDQENVVISFHLLFFCWNVFRCFFFEKLYLMCKVYLYEMNNLIIGQDSTLDVYVWFSPLIHLQLIISHI